MQPSAIQRFLDLLRFSLESGSFVKLTLGHPADLQGALRKRLFRPVLIKGEKRCSVVSRFQTRDETKNLRLDEVSARVEAELGKQFLSANLFTETGEAQLELGKKERLRVSVAARPPASLHHDRDKSRKVDSHARFLERLGVTDATGKVKERMGDKFRQIERFVDLLASAFRESELPARRSDAPVTLCDMGAGKGYLTFAAYDYFVRVEGRAAAVTGVEAREDLVTLCNRVAQETGFRGLGFVRNSIGEFELPSLDILVALHACDTATDDALAAGVQAQARIILTAPCCHKEIRPQIDAPGAAANGPLRDLLRYGIFAERHAEMATDALRALLLERAGYRVRVSEFIAAEHTAKNVMIIATRRPGGIAGMNAGTLADLDERIAALKNFYGIRQHRLERNLQRLFLGER